MLESSPSNVDNLQRRAREKIEDAERLVETLAALRETTDGASADEGTETEDTNDDE